MSSLQIADNCLTIKVMRLPYVVLVCFALLAGCGKTEPNLATVDVPPATLEPGWSTFKRDGSLVRLAIPPNWGEFQVERARAMVAAFPEAAQATLDEDPDPSNIHLCDYNPASYKEPALSTIAIRWYLPSYNTTLQDTAAKIRRRLHLRWKVDQEETMPIRRLPIGPVSQAVLTIKAKSLGGALTTYKVQEFIATTDKDAYLISFRYPLSAAVIQEPLIPKIMDSFRIISNEKAEDERQKLTEPAP